MKLAGASLVALAGLLGAAGVSLAAAAAHISGDETLRAAAEMAMVHAAGVIGLVGFSQNASRPRLWRFIAAAMLLGAWLFTGTVALGQLADFRPLPMLAPVGGTITILSWIAVALAGALEWIDSGTPERR